MSHSTGVWDAKDVALILIDYQKNLFDGVQSEISADLIELNVRFLIKAAQAFDIPIILSTVGVEMGANKPTIQTILDELPGIQVIDRSTMNSWDDPKFVEAVKKTGRRRLAFGALWTEICLAYPVVDALKEGYEATIVVDAVGGRSQLAHTTAIQRLVNVGAIPNTSFALVTEFFRSWESPYATKAREIITWYFAEYEKLRV